MYRAGIEGILGIRRDGAFFVVDPCIPSAWPGFEATVNVGSSRYDISVETASDRCRGVACATLDGAPLSCANGQVRVALDGKTHRLHLSI
jgi:cyclic beta-1,2-glucan synthetase